MRPEPIFVIGVHRSGTTWIANLLCNHSRIFGIQSAQTMGIAESWFFSHLDGRHGDLLVEENFQNFQSDFINTLFCHLSGMDAQSISAIPHDTYSDFFDHFMSQAAIQKSKNREIKYWLEKTPVHTLYIDKILSYYPNVAIVSVHRKCQDVVKSMLKLSENIYSNQTNSIPIYRIWTAILHYQRYKVFQNFYANKFPTNFYRINYEDMLSNSQQVISGCLSFLELEWEDRLLLESFPKNTSFEENNQRETYLNSPLIKTTINIFKAIASRIPPSIYFFYERKRHPRTQEPIPFPYEN